MYIVANGMYLIRDVFSIYLHQTNVLEVKIITFLPTFALEQGYCFRTVV